MLLVASEKGSDIGPLLAATKTEEDWSYIVSLYYTIQTVSTIGFGDVYIYNPPLHSSFHFVLYLKAVLCLLLTTLVIAIFANLFGRARAVVGHIGKREVHKAAAAVDQIEKAGVLIIQATEEQKRLGEGEGY